MKKKAPNPKRNVPGRPPYGKTEEERSIVARIEFMRRNGNKKPFAEIAKLFNAEGLRSRHGKLWNRQLVQSNLESARKSNAS